ECVLLHCLHVEDVADKLVFLAVIPNHLRLAAGYPLQHAALLPAPGVRFAKRDPSVTILNVDHPHLNHVFRRGRAMFKSYLVRQHKAIVR
ncbi:MAG: hypothetical protein ACK56I_17040, partial [bacterium]